MIAPIKCPRSKASAAAWHAGFLAMLPTTCVYARGAFARLNPEAKQDMIAEVIANALVAYVRLYELGKVDLAYGSVLAKFGIAQVRDGRKIGGHLNIKDPLSRYCQKRKGIVVERLDVFDEEENAWSEVIVEDRRAGPADTARARLDFAAWLKQLPQRNRRVAQFLSVGNRTSDAARKFSTSEGRISWLRRELADSWKAFVGDAPASDAGPATF